MTLFTQYLAGSLDLISITTLPLFFGKAVYAYEGIGIVSSTRETHAHAHWTLVHAHDIHPSRVFIHKSIIRVVVPSVAAAIYVTVNLISIHLDMKQILPLENKMKRHEDALKVIFFSMMVVTLLFTLFGVVGYVVYGSDIRASITLNLISSNVTEVV